MNHFFLPCMLVLGLALPADAAETLNYAVKFGGQIKGEHIVEPTEENRFRYRLSYNDRGRGPDLVTELRVDDRGLPVSIRTRGVDYMKNPVDEVFEVKDGKARWKNSQESGEAKADSFYISREGAESGVLLSALLRDPDGSIPLLPAGEARIERVLTHVVEHEGRAQPLVLYAIHGLGFGPQWQWADERGRLFYDGALIRNGWESVTETLDAVQRDADAKRLGALVDTLARSRSDRPLLITNARVFDPLTRKAQDGVSVLVANGRIKAVGADLEPPSDAATVDAKGRFLMPGLWDMHVHNFGGDGGLLHLAAGVTTVRDLASDIQPLLELRDQWHSGATLGPRLHIAGFIDGPGKYAGPSTVLVDTEEEARAAVRRYAELGYEQVKLYNSLDQALLPPIIEEAHRHGLRVSGHVPVHMLAAEAVAAGYDEIQHINHLFLNFLDRGIDNRTPARFIEPGKHGGKLDLDGKPVRDLIALLKNGNVAIDPTLAIFETMWAPRPGEPAPAVAPVIDQLPPVVARFAGGPGNGLPADGETAAQYRATFERALAFVRRLHEEGVAIVPGTDALPGFTLHRELELYARAGIANADVLHLATLGAATVMGQQGDTGRIAPGMRADFILIDGDPLKDIRDIRRTRWVLRDGRLYFADDLRRALGMKVN